MSNTALSNQSCTDAPKTNDAHPSFQWLRSHRIESLDITIHDYQHRETGAQHVHISANNSENVFLVALRTVPQDSTGVAHILEHTALCGSERYPVRDPFFMMIRRSLNTFMNAFTSSDWTAYPFASQNRKDFDNLLSVYLDAVFFARLDPLDFAQEGHRLDFTETGNSESPLIYKGVVYNEMKGAMSSVPSQLWQVLSKYLFPTSTYHYNSGGEPAAITDLSYTQLQDFYRTHYHPSNAIFMTFGDIPAIHHQERFEDLALKRFKRLNKKIQVRPEKRYFSPIRVEEAYAYQRPESASEKSPSNTDQQSHIVIGWLLGSSIDLKRNLELHLLSSLLYDNSASPLQHLLETSALGSSPSPLCGADDSQYEMLFVCGLEGCASTNAAALEESVIQMLQTIVDEGLPQTQIEASLQQLELQQREIVGDGYPYGLQLILNALPPATHRGDIVSFLDLEPALQALRQEIQDRDYIPRLIQQLLLDNPHRVTLTLKPDEQLEQRQQAAEKAALARLHASMSNAEKQQIIEQAKALEKRQQQEENMDILPKVGLADIPKETLNPQGTQQALGQHSLSYYTAGTNGLAYQQLICTLPELTAEHLAALPYYTLCLTEVGIGNDDYLSVQQRQAQIVGNINTYYVLRNHIDDPHQHHAYLTLSAKSLSDKQAAMSELMCDTFTQAEFTEANRLKELIAQSKASKEQSITHNGHGFAMQAAAANFNAIANSTHQLSGLGAIQSIKRLHQELQEGHTGQLQTSLQAIHQQLQTSAKHILLITEEHSLEQQLQKITTGFSALPQTGTNSSSLVLSEPPSKQIQQAWITNSQVHFCAKAYATVPMGHPDAAALSVLGGVLRNGFLHRSIREQGGAYGGGASQDNRSATFRFYSYRDPRFTDTLDDFDRSLSWLFDNNIEKQQLEESILGVVSSIDKPASPAGEAKHHFHAELLGRTNKKREEYRQSIINVSAEDLRRVAETYLRPEKASTAVVTGTHGVEEATRLDLELVYL